MPAAPSSACPRPRPASGVRCPVSGVRCPVRATSVHACLSTGPVSSVRCGRLSVQVSAVRRPLSGVRCGRPVLASGVCVLLRPLCPAEVRSWSAAVGQAAVRLGWPGSAWSPAASMPGSWSACVGAWCSKLAQVVLGRPRRRFGPGRRRGRWLGSGQFDRVADQDSPGAREDHSLVGAGARRARLLRQADRHAAGGSLGRSCRESPTSRADRTHPVSKAELNCSSIYQILLNLF
jgi:hypothetical protein